MNIGSAVILGASAPAASSEQAAAETSEAAEQDAAAAYLQSVFALAFGLAEPSDATPVNVAAPPRLAVSEASPEAAPEPEAGDDAEAADENLRWASRVVHRLPEQTPANALLSASYPRPTLAAAPRIPATRPTRPMNAVPQCGAHSCLGGSAPDYGAEADGPFHAAGMHHGRKKRRSRPSSAAPQPRPSHARRVEDSVADYEARVCSSIMHELHARIGLNPYAASGLNPYAEKTTPPVAMRPGSTVLLRGTSEASQREKMRELVRIYGPSPTVYGTPLRGGNWMMGGGYGPAPPSGSHRQAPLPASGSANRGRKHSLATQYFPLGDDPAYRPHVPGRVGEKGGIGGLYMPFIGSDRPENPFLLAGADGAARHKGAPAPRSM